MMVRRREQDRRGDHSAAQKLQRSVLTLMTIHWFGLMAVAGLIAALWSPAFLTRWFPAAATVMVFVHVQLCLRLSLNRPPGSGRLNPSLGAANQITLARGWGISLIAGFIFLQNVVPMGADSRVVWVPGILYLLLAVADCLDGIWARVTSGITILGQKLDTELDAFGLLTASVVAVAWDRLPAIYLLVGASYYFFRIGIWVRRRRGRTVYPLIDRPFARVMAGIQMVFVGLALLPLFAASLLHLAAIVFMLPLLAGFLWDWLIIQGRPSNRTRETIARCAGILAAGSPVVMRAIVLFSVPAVTGALQGSEIDWAAGAWWLLAAMIVLGFLGRAAAMIAAGLLAHAAVGINAPILPVAFAACVVLIITGTGSGSCWKPEDDLMALRMGGVDSRNAARRAAFSG